MFDGRDADTQSEHISTKSGEGSGSEMSSSTWSQSSLIDLTIKTSKIPPSRFGSDLRWFGTMVMPTLGLCTCEQYGEGLLLTNAELSAVLVRVGKIAAFQLL